MDVNLAGILEAALEQGIWAALYIYLFFRMLSEMIRERLTETEKYPAESDVLQG